MTGHEFQDHLDALTDDELRAAEDEAADRDAEAFYASFPPPTDAELEEMAARAAAEGKEIPF